MKSIALIVSLNFRAAHISHLVASYLQMEKMGYETFCYVHPDAVSFLPKDVRYITTLKGIKKVAIAIFWFPSLRNIIKMVSLKCFHGSKLVYVFHEPIEKFSTYIQSGNSLLRTVELFLKYYVALSFLALSDHILLPSKKAMGLYEGGVSRFINKSYSYLPLMYTDERTEKELKKARQYVSYIGGISKDHAFDEFIDFIYEAYRRKEFGDIGFLVATWNKICRNDKINEMLKAGVLRVKEGKPMTNEEINSFYASSFFVWNAYNRSTQSGVLAKAFMFGTPAIVMSKNLSEFVVDGVEVVAVEGNRDYASLSRAAHTLIENSTYFSRNARQNYERNYDYQCHNNKVKQILKSIGLRTE